MCLTQHSRRGDSAYLLRSGRVYAPALIPPLGGLRHMRNHASLCSCIFWRVVVSTPVTWSPITTSMISAAGISGKKAMAKNLWNMIFLSSLIEPPNPTLNRSAASVMCYLSVRRSAPAIFAFPGASQIRPKLPECGCYPCRSPATS